MFENLCSFFKLALCPLHLNLQPNSTDQSMDPCHATSMLTADALTLVQTTLWDITCGMFGPHNSMLCHMMKLSVVLQSKRFWLVQERGCVQTPDTFGGRSEPVSTASSLPESTKEHVVSNM